MLSLAAMDASFGPQLPGHFDFTVLFQHSMLWLLPACVLVLMTPVYFKGILRARRQIRPGALLWAKLACSLALAGIQTCNIVLWHRTDYFHSKATVAACSMSLIASICTIALVYITHSYYLQPSTFLGAFFSITVLFDITMARSYYLRGNLKSIAALQVSAVVIRCVLVILEELSKRDLIVSEEQQSATSTERLAGFWNRSFFLWLNPFLIFGWRKFFTLDNLPNIGDEFASQKLFDLFSPRWVTGTDNPYAMSF